jgi:predicted nucleic acid-binding protein
MAGRFVLDASAAVSWLLRESEVEGAHEILDLLDEGEAIVPPNWSLEVCNAVRKAIRTDRLTTAMAMQLQNALLSLPIEVDLPSVERDWTVVLALALQHGLSTYDAAYLELALREGIPLATFDQQLRKCAETLGVTCVGSEHD